MLGGVVCRHHGGAAPQTMRKAKERLADLIDPDGLLREVARLALSDIGELFDAGGNLKPIRSLPEGIRRSISSVEVIIKNAAAGDGHTDVVHKVKLWDKPASQALLARLLGLLVDQSEVKHGGVVELRWMNSPDEDLTPAPIDVTPVKRLKAGIVE